MPYRHTGSGRVMALDRAPAPALTVIDGGRTWQQDEAHMELLTLFAEIQVAARVIVNAVTGLPVPSMLAINEAQRLSYRAERAREEWLALGIGAISVGRTF